jgi:hypothetical protein
MTTTVAEAFIRITQEADSEWIQRKRKVDTKMLIMNVAQGKVNRIGLRQLSFTNDAVCSAAALVQAKHRIPTNTLSRVLGKLNNRLSAAKGRRILAIDSTKISLPLRFKAQGVAPRNDAAKKPLIMCSTLHDVRLDIPLDVVVADHHNERRALILEHRPRLRSGDLIVGDRGYFSREVCRELMSINVDVLFRVKENACRPILDFVASRRKERIIELEGGLRVTCFKYTLSGQRYILVTTDPNMTLSRARTTYKARWRIEEGFRRWKSDFNLCRNVAHSLHNFKVDVLIVAIAHALVRSQLAVTVMRRTNETDTPEMQEVCIRALRACALALFAVSYSSPWHQAGILIHTRRACLY